MKREADFSRETKETLAKRSRYLCANPNCKNITCGAHSNPKKSIIIGKACHIEAASRKGPRFNNNLALDERKSINNGIWLCSNCASMIDLDESMYTVEVLKRWKYDAEQNVKNALYANITNKDVINRNEIRIVAITNVSGGVGKSTVTAALSEAIGRIKERKVLCLSAVDGDDAISYFGKEIEDLPFDDYFSKLPTMDHFENNIYEGSKHVDLVSCNFLEHYRQMECMCYGTSNLYKSLIEIADRKKYQYIVCDCGRSETSYLQKEILFCAKDIIIPLGDHIGSCGGVMTIGDILAKKEEHRRVWILNSKGLWQSSGKLVNMLHKELTEMKKTYLDKYGYQLNEFPRLIPKTVNVRSYPYRANSIFTSSKARSVAEAYLEVANELIRLNDT